MLVHVPETFDVRKPGVIVVFFHGNGATLERDVRDRQLVPQQISDSGVNAVLLAPQLAVNAADSSAGKFWQPGGFKRFIDESASHLARLYGDPKSAQAFANMPIVIVGYSGGFLPTAWSLEVGGIPNRVRGVFLLDAVYGELDKFASWIEKNRTGFFVSSYTRYTKRRDQELMADAARQGHHRHREHGRAAAARQRRVRADARRRHPSRLRDAGLDRTSGQGRAGQDGGNARVDPGRQRALRKPVTRRIPSCIQAAVADTRDRARMIWLRQQSRDPPNLGRGASRAVRQRLKPLIVSRI